MKKFIEETLNLIVEDLDNSDDTLKSLASVMMHHKKDLENKMADGSLETYDLSRKAKMLKSNARRLRKVADLLIGCQEALDLIVKYEEEKEV